ncbi:MAG: DUF2095 family protein [Nitrososphaerota archaeon]
MNEIDEEEFKKNFPNLYREIIKKKMSLRIDSIRTKEGEKNFEEVEKHETYMPTAIDYLRRCENDKEGEEVISYLENKGEISHEYAEELRTQLREKGIRSFGSKKEDGYYLKKWGGY